MKKKLWIWGLIFSGVAPVFGQQQALTPQTKQSVDSLEINKQHNDGHRKGERQAFPEKNLVRLSKITVDPARLESYKAYLKEEAEAAMRLEPGVLILYAVSEKEHPNRFTILEIYADEAAYQNHIETPHFRKYKQGTLDMVQELQLIDCDPLIPGLRIAR